MSIYKYIRFVFFILFGLYGTSVAAQDMMAMQAPIDRRHKAVDTLVLNRLVKKERVENPSADLYTTWNTSTVHCYANEAVPESYRIDLRDYTMPTPSRQINSKYGYRPAFRRFHKGLDIKVYVGDTIKAAFSGKVRIVDFERGGYGNYVVIRHDNGLETVYGHLSKHLVKTNDYVQSGQPIGLGGSTGMSTGSHLHFETRLLGEAIDPALLFDFANQDVTGDFYVYKRKGGAKSAPILAENKGKSSNPNTGTGPVATKQTSSSGGHYHKVKKGETLYSISRKLNISLDKLCSANHITKKSSIRPGQILKY